MVPVCVALLFSRLYNNTDGARVDSAEVSFQDGIKALVDQNPATHLYPRPDLYNLSVFLRSRGALRRVEPQESATNGAAPPPSLVNSTVVVQNLQTRELVTFGTAKGDEQKFSRIIAQSQDAKIVFLRGYVPPRWLNVVGAGLDIRPETYRQHLDFKPFTRSGHDLCVGPGLPSASEHVFQLTIPTICSRADDGVAPYGPQNLQPQRDKCATDMDEYFKQLTSRAQPADSVVRRCLVLSKHKYVIEQTITIEVRPRDKADQVRAVIWLDIGKDLSKSLPGPWWPSSRHDAVKYPWETYFFPIVVEGANDSSPNWSASQDSIMEHLAGGNNGAETSTWQGAQNIATLPFHYNSNPEGISSGDDTLYLLGDLFRFAACAEKQFLNFLRLCVAIEISSVGRSKTSLENHHAVPLVNLAYIKTQAGLHAQRLSTIIKMLQNREWLAWPTNTDVGPKTAALLLADYQDLLQRAEAMVRECEQGMTTLVNAAALEDSRRSAENAMRMQRLTVLATIFIPLSFICAIWGMNFREFGTGNLSIWLWFVTAAPVLCVSFVIYFFEKIMAILYAFGQG